MRGKGKVKGSGIDFVRITPAYAGKRMGGLKMAQDFEDHPRLCGEKLIRKRLTIISLGSPPPMRGKGIVEYISKFHNGITPAYAGKSPTLFPWLLRT